MRFLEKTKSPEVAFETKIGTVQLEPSGLAVVIQDAAIVVGGDCLPFQGHKSTSLNVSIPRKVWKLILCTHCLMDGIEVKEDAISPFFIHGEVIGEETILPLPFLDVWLRVEEKVYDFACDRINFVRILRVRFFSVNSEQPMLMTDRIGSAVGSSPSRCR